MHTTIKFWRGSHRGRGLRWLSVALALALVASACSGDDPEPSTAPPGEAPEASAGTESSRAAGSPGDNLSISLSAGQALGGAPGDADEPTVVEGRAIGNRRVQQVLDRLGPWNVPDETTDFNRPAETLPPPVAGETVPAPFPAPEPAPVEEVPRARWRSCASSPRVKSRSPPR